MRVAVDKLIDDTCDDVVDGKRPLATRKLGLKNHLEKQVAQLFAQRAATSRVDGVDDFAGLFEDVLTQTLE